MTSGVIISSNDSFEQHAFENQYMDKELRSSVKPNHSKLKIITPINERRERLNNRISNRIVRLHSLSQQVVSNIRSKDNYNEGILRIIFNYLKANQKSLV